MIAVSHRSRRPILLEGPPGVGKSEIVGRVASDLGIECITIDLSLCEPSDLVGLPRLEGDRTEFVPPATLPRSGEGLLVFEELNRAERFVQGPVLQLLSARRLNSYELPAGWFIRGLHHYGASAMVVLSVLHMVRVIFYGAYKFPREMTWITGVLLLLITIGFGFAGYLLPWDQKAYWGSTVGTKIAGTPPFIGDFILRVMRGGQELSEVTLARFFGVHVWVLPVLLFLLIGVHMYLIIRIGISAPPKREKTHE